MRIKNYLSFLEESNGIEGEKTFKFSELSPEAKEKALENNRYINVDFPDWEDWIIEEFKDQVKEFGINDINVEYTGFYSQGDGASFTSDDIDTRKLFQAAGIKSNENLDMSTREGRDSEEDKEIWDLLDALEDIGINNKKIKPEDISVTIRRISSRHYHENTVEANVEIQEEPEGWREPPNFVSDLEYDVTKFIRSLCRKLYRMIEDGYHNEISDESVEEAIEANDLRFKEDGSPG